MAHPNCSSIEFAEWIPHVPSSSFAKNQLQADEQAAEERPLLESLRLQIKGLRQWMLLRKANFNPNQPRVPAGNPDGGRWAATGGTSLLRQRIRQNRRQRHQQDRLNRIRLAGRRGAFIIVRTGRNRLRVATPAQVNRYTFSVINARDALAQAHRIRPNWKPRPSFQTETIIGDTLRNEFIAREALNFVRAQAGASSRHGPRGNNPPTHGFEPTPPRSVESQLLRSHPSEFFSTYRTIIGMPNTGNRIANAKSDGTLAVAEIGDQVFVGANSASPGYTLADEAAAKAIRGVLIQKYPDIMKTRNIGQKPNNALFHAEATLLLRAARAHGGNLAGQSVTIRIDRRMCDSCDKVLPYIIEQLGSPSLRVVQPNGNVLRLQSREFIPEAAR